MGQFIEGFDRQQAVFLPECPDDYGDENSPVRVIDAFIDMLNLAELGFQASPAATGRPGYHPGLMLRIYRYGYLNRVQSSRRLERECGCSLDLIWLTGRLKPDFKTIADFRKEFEGSIPLKTGWRSARSASRSSRYAATSICWTGTWWPLMAAGSRR
jgi:transposase